MQEKKENIKIIISGGGTGGHLFPALSIAEALRKKNNNIEILFVGAKGKIEMTKVPEHGFNIIGLPIEGFKRKALWKNFSVLLKLLISLYRSHKIIKTFSPHAIIGVGGYASAPIVYSGAKSKIKCFIQEQNSYAGITNKVLAKYANKIFVAYDGMDKYFPANKIILTGNPVRSGFENIENFKDEAIKYFDLDKNKKTILCIGGSLGAKTLNNSILNNISIFNNNNVQLIWQCGNYYYDEIKNALKYKHSEIKLYDFITKMHLAYAAADLIISRAGAGSISELCVVGKPVILVPSPNVAEDHQTKNALAIVNKHAALMINDSEAVKELIPLAINTLNNAEKCAELSKNIKKLAITDASEKIADFILESLHYEHTNNIDSSSYQVDRFNNFYFLGIGGIGMSALARYCKKQNKNVAGYDKTPSSLTKQLEDEGILIHYDDSIDNIPHAIKNYREKTLVVFTPAVPANNIELNYFIKNKFTITKRAQLLGNLFSQKKGLAVAGTHGKTTTSTLLAHILTKSKIGCNAFLGGISKNYNTNLLLSPSEYIVAEADEYDRSFLNLYPYSSIITSIDADHLEIYGTHDEIIKAFNLFTKQIRPNGVLIYKKNLPINTLELIKINSFTYSLNDDADFFAFDIRNDKGGQLFNLKTPDKIIENLWLALPGKMNIENAVAASALALLVGIEENELREGLSTFQGVKRRFEYHIKKDDFVYIDDYAHHPEEIKACIESARSIYSKKKITGVFQPHLFTRTRDFADEFAKSLSMFDEVILLDIYPAREEPINNVSSEIIFDKITCNKKYLCNKNDLLDLLKKLEPEVLITMGAGDIDRMVEPIVKIFEKNN